MSQPILFERLSLSVERAKKCTQENSTFDFVNLIRSTYQQPTEKRHETKQLFSIRARINFIAANLQTTNFREFNKFNRERIL